MQALSTLWSNTVCVTGVGRVYTLTSPKSSRLPLRPPHALLNTKGEGEMQHNLIAVTTVPCPSLCPSLT